jgi:putative DNA primase/helicase
MDPGCKHDHVLTLIGKQGILKSKLLATLVPDPSWFSDSLTHDMADKDAIVGLAGVWICEMAELAALNKTDFALAKAFLSRQIDKYRPPYGRLDVRLPRQVAFFATTNIAEPFKDETGNRRYWPVECGRIENGAEVNLDPDGLAAIRDQLWAEAVGAFDRGETWWLSSDLEGIARAEQDRRRAVHPLVPRVAKTLKLIEPPFTIDEILTRWEVRPTDWVRVSMEVGKALVDLHYSKRRVMIDGTRQMLWKPPDDA